jgi:hypothetical protein
MPDLKMTSYDAALIAELNMEPPGDTEEEKDAAFIAAWQLLIDTGLVWELQGWFGRQADQMIEEGLCTKKK